MLVSLIYLLIIGFSIYLLAGWYECKASMEREGTGQRIQFCRGLE